MINAYRFDGGQTAHDAETAVKRRFQEHPGFISYSLMPYRRMSETSPSRR
ncbi:hypothetical protein [Streptomyces sp. NPDC058583]